VTRFTLCAVSIACLVAASLPVAMTNPAVVYVEKKPLMWLECSQTMKVERDRICSARKKSARTRL
jgi:hypothetical protein